MQSVPAQMPPVIVLPGAQTKSERCFVRLSWQTPFDGGREIEQYKLEALADSGEFHAISQKCGEDPEETTCLVSMITLYAPPFNIQDGRLIQFRAYAKNEMGWSRPSELNVVGENLIGKPA